MWNGFPRDYQDQGIEKNKIVSKTRTLPWIAFLLANLNPDFAIQNLIYPFIKD